jgi:uncharacterized protein
VNTFAIVGVYAALNVFVLAWLAWVTGNLRRKHSVLIGDGGVPALIRVMRGHANAMENMPMFFIMLIVASGIGAPAPVLHGLAAVFTIGRALHAWHFAHEDASMRLRVIGFGATILPMLVLAVGLLAHGVARAVH